jgi:hypothetical protein
VRDLLEFEYNLLNHLRLFSALTLLSSYFGRAALAPVVELEVRVGALALLPAQVTRRRVSLAVVSADVFARCPRPVGATV